jgi:hypothetical protein
MGEMFTEKATLGLHIVEVFHAMEVPWLAAQAHILQMVNKPEDVVILLVVVPPLPHALEIQ